MKSRTQQTAPFFKRWGLWCLLCVIQAAAMVYMYYRVHIPAVQAAGETGFEQGYMDAYATSRANAEAQLEEAKTEGFNNGYKRGHQIGYEGGKQDGYSIGYREGAFGIQSGYDPY